MTDKKDLPIQISSSAVPAITGTVLGAIALIVSGTATILTTIKAGSLLDAIKWLQGVDGLAYLAAVSFIAAGVWRVASSLKRHQNAVIAAEAAPAKVAEVVEAGKFGLGLAKTALKDK